MTNPDENLPSSLLPAPGMADIRLSPAEFARFLGQSRQSVASYIRKGIVTLGADKKLRLGHALREMEQNLDPARRRRRGPGAVDAAREAGSLRGTIAALEAECCALRAALAGERRRGEAARLATMDAVAGAHYRLTERTIAGLDRMCERHTAAEIQRAARSGALARLFDRYLSEIGFYDAFDAAPHGEGGDA
jgi:hypothetical protein